MVQDNDIKKYINLPHIINNLKKKKSLVRIAKYNRSLYVHPETSGGYVLTISVKPERFVIDLVTCEETLDRMIDRCKMRYKVFNHPGLTYKEYKQLSLSEQEQIKDDCFQAETYTAYHFGYEPPQEDISGDTQDNLKDLASLFNIGA